MSAFLIPDNDLIIRQGNQTDGIDKIAKDMTTFGLFLPPADLGAQKAIEATGHQGELQITGDFHGHG